MKSGHRDTAGDGTDLVRLTKAQLVRRVAELQEELASRSRELDEARRRLAQNDRLSELGRMTATVGHEIRNPLGVMQNSVYLLERNAAGLDSALIRAIERIKRSIGRCDSIVDELLDFSRGIELEPTWVAVDRWLEALLDELDVPEGVTVEFCPELKGRAALFDPEKLRRVAVNILDNAIQAAGTGGGSVTVGTAVSDDGFEIRISDSGSGIPPEERDMVFEPLFSTRQTGLGLGLAIAREIVSQHGGAIDIEDAPAGGACFVLRLPQGEA